MSDLKLETGVLVHEKCLEVLHHGIVEILIVLVYEDCQLLIVVSLYSTNNIEIYASVRTMAPNDRDVLAHSYDCMWY